MRVLMVLGEPPCVDGGPAGKYAIGQIRGLRAHGVQVDTVAARLPFNFGGDPPGDLAVRIIDLSWSWQSRVRHYVVRPFGELARGEFKEWVDQAGSNVDVLHLEELAAAWCDLDTNVPSVARLNYRIGLDETLRLPWTSQFRAFLATAVAERAAIRRHRWLIANSPRVAKSLQEEAPHAEIIIAPLCLDPADYSIARLDGPPIAGIIGTGSWPPTSKAIRRLVSRVWPKVRRRLPDARLLIAGRRMDWLRVETGAGIEFVGAVDSAKEFLRSLSVLIYPVERASGMKIKVLESLAMGLPVVTTVAGAEGIEENDGLVIESDDDRLAAATAQILFDQQERRQRGAAARNAFEARYSPLPATEPLVDLYRRMN